MLFETWYFKLHTTEVKLPIASTGRHTHIHTYSNAQAALKGFSSTSRLLAALETCERKTFDRRQKAESTCALDSSFPAYVIVSFAAVSSCAELSRIFRKT